VLTSGLVQVDKPLTVHAVNAHMHTRGKRVNLTLGRADGRRECMLDIPQWNFHWQRLYGFTSPKTLQPGETMSIECHWENDGEAALNWGEGTGDEMCLAFAYVTQ
jgi:hypothetical protein